MSQPSALLPIQTLAPAALYFANPAGVANQADLFKLLSNALYNLGLINNKERFIRSVMERDQMGPTVVAEQSFAIPHGQDESVLQPSLSVCMFATPLVYQTPFSTAMVKKVFLFALPPAFESHPAYATLQAFSAALVAPRFQDSLTDGTPYSDFCDLANDTMRVAAAVSIN